MPIELKKSQVVSHLMPQSFQIGPLALPGSVLLYVSTVAIAIFVSVRSARARGLDVERVAFRAVVVALVASRLGFVWQFRYAYLQEPLSIVDVRDGGWSAEAGLVTAWLYVMAASRERLKLRRPLVTGMLTASVVWLGATILLMLTPGPGIILPKQFLAAPDGQRFDLATFVGKPTVVNFWATWCPPCLREMPMLQIAQSEDPGTNFVFLNQGESADRVNQFLARHGLTLRNVLLDAKGEVGAKFGQNAFPTTLFFDAQGKLVSSRIGELSRATLLQRLDTVSNKHEPR